MVKLHPISNYAYSITLTNNDYAAKLSLWTTKSNHSNVNVADIKFMYDNNQNIPPHNIQEDSERATLYLPVKNMPAIIDMLRNEKPLVLVLNPPFAFLSTDGLEPAGEGEPALASKKGA